MCVQQMYYLVVCILARDGGIRGEQPHEKKIALHYGCFIM